MNTIWVSTSRDVTELHHAGLERWFDRGMERVSGWYKRRAQIILFVIGVALAILLNASAITAADRLWKDDGLRKGLVAQVEHQQEETTGTDAFDISRTSTSRSDGKRSTARIQAETGCWSLLGWLLTGVAITLGAPFWFDVLGKVSNLRATGIKPDSVLTATASGASRS